MERRRQTKTMQKARAATFLSSCDSPLKMPAGVHAPVQYSKDTNALGNPLEIDGVGDALVSPESIPDETVVGAETRIFGDGIDPGMKHFAVSLSLIHAEVLDAVKVDINQVLLRITCYFNPGHATDPSAALRRARRP